MKKYFILLFGCFSILVSAQSNKIQYGIKAGANLSAYSNSDSPFNDFKPKLGFYIGGLAEIGLMERLTLRPEILLTQYGSVFDAEILFSQTFEPATAERFKSRIDDYTLAVPIHLRFYITEKFAIELGPQLGYIFYRKDTIKENPLDNPPESDINTDAERFTFGISSGLGFKLLDNLMLTTDYYIALKKTNGLKTHVLQLGLDYFF